MTRSSKLAGAMALAASLCLTAGAALAADVEDKAMGEYAGTFTPAGGQAVAAEGKAVGLAAKDGALAYRAILTAGGGKEAKGGVEAVLSGTLADGKVALSGQGWTGTIADGKLLAESKAGKFELKFAVRKSPTELAKPPAGAVVLLPCEPGKPTSLAEWTNAKWAVLPDGSVRAGGGDNRTKRQFKDFKIHVEFQCPYTPGKPSGGRGNSGVYILDRYEIQIIDSFGRNNGKGECGAIYQTTAPKVNASLPPGRWQTYDITFRAARMADGQAVEVPVVTVVLNGVAVHEDAKIPNATGSAKKMGHAASGPIRLQDHSNPVLFRNIWIVERD